MTQTFEKYAQMYQGVEPIGEADILEDFMCEETPEHVEPECWNCRLSATLLDYLRLKSAKA